MPVDYTREFDPNALMQALGYEADFDTPAKARARAAALRGRPETFGQESAAGMGGMMLRGPTAKRVSDALYTSGEKGKRAYADQADVETERGREARKTALTATMQNMKDKRAAEAQAAKDAEAERRWNAEFGLKQRAEGRMASDAAARLEIARANAARVGAASTAAQDAKKIAAGLKQRAEQQGIERSVASGEQNLKTVNAALEHEGRKAATGASGAIASHLPFTKARAYQGYHDQLTGGAFLTAFETLKGGGQITEIEGAKATAAITRLNTPGLPEEDYELALEDLKQVISDGIERTKSQGRQIGMYGGMEGVPPAAGAPQGPRDYESEYGVPR